jgi:hypothetical protein
MTKQPVRDEELDTAFFAGLDSKEVADVPEPASLRPCCIFGTDVGAQVRSVPVPLYEIHNILDIDTLGTHQYNKGSVALVPRGGERVVSDEESGILYTCRGGFIDISHVRDNADRTLFFASQIARRAATGGVIPIAGEGATRRIVVKQLDQRLVREYGLREVVVSLAEWLDFQASIWHEIATWYGWASTRFSEKPSAFSPEDLYSNVVGLKIAGVAIRRQEATTELEYNRAVTALLRDALKKLGPCPRRPRGGPSSTPTGSGGIPPSGYRTTSSSGTGTSTSARRSIPGSSRMPRTSATFAPLGRNSIDTARGTGSRWD